MACQGGVTCWNLDGQAPPLSILWGSEAKTHPGTLGRLLGIQVFCDLEGREKRSGHN